MQLEYKQYSDPAIQGALSGIGPKHILSYVAEEDIPVGYPVMLGTDPQNQVKKATTGASVIGISVHDYAREQDSQGNVLYKDTQAVSCLAMGQIWVKTAKEVTAGKKANLSTADGTFTDAEVTSGIEAITLLNCVFLTSTSKAGELALLEVK